MTGFYAIRIGLMRDDHRVRDIDERNLRSVVVDLADEIVVVPRPTDHDVFDESPIERLFCEYKIVFGVGLKKTAAPTAFRNLQIVLNTVRARKTRKRSENVGSTTYQKHLWVIRRWFGPTRWSNEPFWICSDIKSRAGNKDE